MEAAQQEFVGVAGMAMREKFWDEKSVEEKLEVLRQEAIWQHNMLQRIASAAHRMEEHSHATDGTLMVPLNSRRNELQGGGLRDAVPHRLRTKAEAERW